MGNVPMTRPEEVLAIHETNYFHSSTFVELEDGRVLQAAGTAFSISEDGGITWSKPFTCQDRVGNLVGGGGTSLVKLSERGIGLAAIWKVTDQIEPKRSDSQGKNHLIFWRSKDEGETWEEPVQVTEPGTNTHAYQDVMLRTSSGRIIIPAYAAVGQATGLGDMEPPVSGKLMNGQWVSTAGHFFDPRFTFSFICYSDDDGQTWQRNRDGELLILQDWNATYSYTNEPSVTEVTPGRLLMLMRTGLGRLFQAWSEDNGETWTRPQATSLASSTTPAQIRKLPNEHLLLVWNQESEEEIKLGFNRTRLSSAISRNGGSVWEFFQNVESIHEETRVEPGPIRPVRPAEYHFSPGVPAPHRNAKQVLSTSFHGRWSYPSVFVMNDRVLIAHTYSIYEEHPDRAEMILSNRKEGGFNQKLKVLPLTWFYGGKKPADNPFLHRNSHQTNP